jgi:UDP-glucose 4-epimerase
MTQKPLGLSGASSFTGIWIAREFASRGWQVHGLLSQSGASKYEGLKKVRLDQLMSTAQVHFGVRAEDETMTSWISKNRPEIWIHHHHFMDNFRGADYDEKKAFETGVRPLESLVKALKSSGCKGIIFSGSYFEPGEGGAASAEVVRTPYARSKKLVWEELAKLCKTHHLPLSKIVIPNPIGPFENEDRVIPILIKRSIDGSALQLFAPDSLSDNLPIWSLAHVYADIAEGLLKGEEKIVRPSGWVATAKDFVEVVNGELVVKNLKQTLCKTEIKPNGKPPMSFENPATERISLDLDQCWSSYASELRKAMYLTTG